MVIVSHTYSVAVPGGHFLRNTEFTLEHFHQKIPFALFMECQLSYKTKITFKTFW